MPRGNSSDAENREAEIEENFVQVLCAADPKISQNTLLQVILQYITIVLLSLGCYDKFTTHC